MRATTAKIPEQAYYPRSEELKGNFDYVMMRKTCLPLVPFPLYGMIEHFLPWWFFCVAKSTSDVQREKEPVFAPNAHVWRVQQ